MELRIQIDDVDFGELAAQILPLLPDGADSLGGGILMGSVRKNPALLKGMINSMPKKKQEEMAIALINRNSEKIGQAIGEAAAKQGITLKLGRVRAGNVVKKSAAAAKPAQAGVISK